MINKLKIALWCLRVGIAFTFLYAAVDGFINPAAWIGFLPGSLTSLFPASSVLAGFEIYELILGIWLLSGWKSFYPAMITAATMVGIIVSSPTQFLITFRDVAIFGASLALAALTKE